MGQLCIFFYVDGYLPVVKYLLKIIVKGREIDFETFLSKYIICQIIFIKRVEVFNFIKEFHNFITIYYLKKYDVCFNFIIDWYKIIWICYFYF